MNLSARQLLLRLSGIYVLYVLFRLWVDGEEEDRLRPWPPDGAEPVPYDHPERVGLGSI